jgi:hypothetical protein
MIAGGQRDAPGEDISQKTICYYDPRERTLEQRN